jgi:two-component system, NtrC family, response regulator AtoC
VSEIRVLIVDDEVQLVKAFKKKLTEEGFAVSTASTGQEALSMIESQQFDVGVLDIRLPDIDGVELLERIRKAEPSIEVVMLTAYASVDTAIRSMKRGAYDYLSKPCKLSELSKVILKAYEKKSLSEKTRVLEEQLHRVEGRDQFIGMSRQIMDVKQLISVVAPSDVPVLILGETGTGKELVARAIHAESRRSPNQFVAVNSSTLQENILESELFGYKRGAFTGAHGDKIGLLEIADKGTFFVDEVGDMNPVIQAKLLRVLEAGIFRKLGDTREIKVDVRFIFATNKRLDEEVRTTRFRQDLFYRLSTFTIFVPPLRERKEDIALLIDYFLTKLARGATRKLITPEARDYMSSYGWPGNVRELANVLERAYLVSRDREEIGLEDLPQAVLHSNGGTVGQDPPAGTDSLRLDQMEKGHIERVMKLVSGNKSMAARFLGISRKTLYQKIGKE